MKKRQGVVLTTAHNVQAFLDAHATLLGLGVTSARRNLDDAAQQLADMAKTQVTSGLASKGATAQQHALVATLRNHYMRPVSSVAKVVLAEAPEIGTMAVKTKGLTPTQLVAAAQGMADAAEQYAEVFKVNGLPDDFTTQSPHSSRCGDGGVERTAAGARNRQRGGVGDEAAGSARPQHDPGARRACDSETRFERCTADRVDDGACDREYARYRANTRTRSDRRGGRRARITVAGSW